MKAIPGTTLTKQATVRDVAKQAQVSTATVSRVIHGKKVRPGVRERVDAAMSALQYKPNLAARSLRSNASHIVACAIRGLLMPELAPFIRAAERVLREAGYTLLLTSADEHAETQKQLLERLTRRGVDGLLFTASSDEKGVLRNAMKDFHLPTVLLDRDAGFVADATIVDHRNGIRLAVDYLASLGHRRISLVTVPENFRPGRERISAFKDALTANGIEFDAALFSDNCLDSAQASRYLAQILNKPRPPTAIISGGMALLGSVLRAVNMQSLQIPQDISIIAGCDSELAELANPGITAIRWDVAAWGEISAQLLLERMASPVALEQRTWTMPTELIVRKSCRPLRTAPYRR